MTSFVAMLGAQALPLLIALLTRDMLAKALYYGLKYAARKYTPDDAEDDKIVKAMGQAWGVKDDE